MPTLLVEYSGRRMIADLSQRVIIGRVLGSEVRIADRSVSRIHAWIAPIGDDFYITDAGSRFGSRLNGHLFHGRAKLKDGDQIRIGPAKMRFRAKMDTPAGFESIDLEDAARQRSAELVDCDCGAPLWTPWDFAVQIGRCRYCGNQVNAVVQHETPPAAAAAATGTCGACHSEIEGGEETTCCPDCGVSFHANCWTENLGCSSYGCKQVGILDPAHTSPPVDIEPSPSIEIAPDEPVAKLHVDWSYPMLAAALGSAVAGLLAFGVPPAICLIGISVYRVRAGTKLQRGLLVASTLITLVATGAGAAFSWYWWLAGRTSTRVALL
jgi:hypothetical protein